MKSDCAQGPAVVIVSYFQDEYLPALFDSLSKQSLPPLSTVLVCNSPPKNSPPPGIDLICSGENRGYASAANRGILRAMERGAGSFLLLNADVFLDSRCLEKLCNAPGDIVQPLLLLARNPQRINAAGLKPTRLGFAYCMKYMRRMEEAGCEPVRIPAASGAAMFIRREVIERAGLFDEGFFLYLEDVEFCLRARGMGFEVFLEPGAKVWHHYRWNLGLEKFRLLWRNAREMRRRFGPELSGRSRR